MRGRKHILWSLLLAASCSGSPFTEGGGTPTPTPTPGSLAVPAKVNRNVNGATYVPGDATISLNITSQDATALNATYNRDPTYDVTGYQAYTYQSSTSNRYVLALVRATSSIKGLVAADGGQFATYHAGGDFVRITAFTLPAAGVAGTFNYSGTYVGLMNLGTQLPGPGGTFDPTRAFRTTGRTLITADFTEMNMSGGVDQHRIVDPVTTSSGLTTQALPSFELYDTTITSAGSFAGAVYIGGIPVGDYAGLFGGLNAKEIALLLQFNPLPSATIFEHGLIVLDNCVSSGGGGVGACP